MKTRISSSLALMVVLLWSTVTFAGTLKVQDRAGTLSAQNIATLRETVSRWPFDLHLIVETVPNLAALQSDAKAAIDIPNTIAIALDPKKGVAFEAGVGAHIARGDYSTIQKAGNTYFKAGDIVSGVTSIGEQARSSVVSVPAPQVAPQVPQSYPVRQVAPPMPASLPAKAESGGHGWLWFFLAVGFVVAFLLWRRSVRRERDGDFRADAPSPPIGGYGASSQAGAYRSTGYSAPTSTYTQPPAGTTVVNNHYGSPAPVAYGYGYGPTTGTDVALGVAAGALTAVAVEEALHAGSRREVIEREVIVERDGYARRSYDAGGAVSSFDDGGAPAAGRFLDDSESSVLDAGGAVSSFDDGGDGGGATSFDDTGSSGSSSWGGDSDSSSWGGDSDSSSWGGDSGGSDDGGASSFGDD